MFRTNDILWLEGNHGAHEKIEQISGVKPTELHGENLGVVCLHSSKWAWVSVIRARRLYNAEI